MMMYQPNVPPGPPSKEERERREGELRRDFKTPIPVFYIVVSIAIVLFLIVGFVVVYGFHLF